MSLNRRELLRTGAASGALLVAAPTAFLAGCTPPQPASRASRLFPQGTRLAHTDLHNHSLLSDGAGDAAAAFASMRSAGLDVAALTDHSTVGYGLPGPPCSGECQALAGIDEADWQRMAALADAAQDDGEFTALRGFEWSSPTLGHLNVWFSERWIDPLHTGGVGSGEGGGSFVHDGLGIDPSVGAPLDELIRSLPTTGVGMAGFYDWLLASPGRALLGGGSDALVGFNHPGRERGRFSNFTFRPELRDRVVSLELFNRSEDYLFEGTDLGSRSPLVECLDAGWRVGLLGVSDDHGTRWGFSEGRGRAGLWVKTLTRAGVREALAARRFFATKVTGLRVDASANGVRMGSTLGHRRGTVQFRIDVDRGSQWWGRRMSVQLLRPGGHLPAVAHAVEVTLPRSDQPVLSFSAPVDLDDGPWAVLRVTDPSLPADPRAPAAYRRFGEAVAYTSPFFLAPPR